MLHRQISDFATTENCVVLVFTPRRGLLLVGLIHDWIIPRVPGVLTVHPDDSRFLARSSFFTITSTSRMRWAGIDSITATAFFWHGLQWVDLTMVLNFRPAKNIHFNSNFSSNLIFALFLNWPAEWRACACNLSTHPFQDFLLLFVLE